MVSKNVVNVMQNARPVSRLNLNVLNAQITNLLN